MPNQIIYNQFVSNGFHFTTKNDIACLDYVVDKNALKDSISIPSHVTNDGRKYPIVSINGFEGSRLTEVILPSTIVEIFVGAFSDCLLLKHVQLNNGIEEIGSFAFNCCYNLTNIELPSSLRKIGNDSFRGCQQLQTIQIPEGIEEIEYNSFEACWHLQKISIPSTLKQVGDYAFNGCSRLTEIVIPDNVTSIGEGAFASCNNLNEITIGKNVREIGDYAFSVYTVIGLNVYNRSRIPQKISEETFGNLEGTLHVPIGSLSAYKSTPVWKNFKTILDDIYSC